MIRLRFQRALSLGFCLFLAPPLFADDPVAAASLDSARSMMKEGVAAFSEGDTTRARSLLEQALAQGLDSHPLRYNLGVLYYHLELYGLAREQFQKLVDTRHRGLALYNLGLIAQAEKNHLQARDYFGQVARQAEQEKLRRLARLQLEGQDTTVIFPRPWSGFLSLGMGYEHNLALLPDSAATDVSDTFNDLLLVATGPVWELGSRESRADSINLSGSAFRRHYHSEADYSNDAAQVGVSWVSRGGADTYQLGLQQSWFRVGGESREAHSTLEVRYREAGCLAIDTGRCSLRANVSWVSPSEDFAAYEGARYLLQGGYRYRWGEWRGHSRVRLELNDRQDLRQGEQFVSVSPRRQELEAGAEYLGFWPLSIGATVGLRYSDYPDAYELVAGPGLESGRRVDRRYSLSFTADYSLSANWLVSADVSYLANESSLDQYTYNNQVIQFSLDYLL